MNSSKVAVRGATLLVVVPSRGWSGFTSAPDLLAVRESMNVCLTSGLTIRMDASTTFCGHIPITPRFWGVGHLRPLPPATDHATKCSRTIVSELIGSVNTSVFLVTYLVRLPTTGLLGHNSAIEKSARPDCGAADGITPEWPTARELSGRLQIKIQARCRQPHRS